MAIVISLQDNGDGTCTATFTGHTIGDTLTWYAAPLAATPPGTWATVGSFVTSASPDFYTPFGIGGFGRFFSYAKNVTTGEVSVPVYHTLAAPGAIAGDPLTTPLTLLAEMVADCAAFRMQAGLDANDLLAREKLIDGQYGSPRRVYFLEADSAAELIETNLERLPIAVVQWDASAPLGFDQKAAGNQNHLRPSGLLRMLIADNDRAGGEIRAGALLFSHFAGMVLQQLADQAAVDDRLAIRAIKCDLPPTAPSIADDAAAGRYWVIGAGIEWNA